LRSQYFRTRTVSLLYSRVRAIFVAPVVFRVHVCCTGNAARMREASRDM
jgi:hypothetical protein